MPLLEIDQSLCEGCGLCVTDCIAGIIEQNESGFPSISPEKEKLCYKCQHCLAVCPTGALSILGKNPSDSLDLSQLSLPSYEQTDNFIRSRRSIRSYEDKNVDPALLEKLLKTLAFAPTGSNCQELTFNLIDDKREMRKFSELLADSVVEASKDENVVRQIPRIKVFARYPKEELISKRAACSDCLRRSGCILPTGRCRDCSFVFRVFGDKRRAWSSLVGIAEVCARRVSGTQNKTWDSRGSSFLWHAVWNSIHPICSNNAERGCSASAKGNVLKRSRIVQPIPERL
jgi:Fe-S-cluster-containing hydrogenase component 2